MTAAQMHRRHGIGRNAPHGTTRNTKPNRVVGTIHRESADPRSEFNDEEWHEMVATAAYYRAEARGFYEGSPEDDWYEAEAELRERFGAADSHVETVSTSGGGAANIETTGE